MERPSIAPCLILCYGMELIDIELLWYGLVWLVCYGTVCCGNVHLAFHVQRYVCVIRCLLPLLVCCVLLFVMYCVCH